VSALLILAIGLPLAAPLARAEAAGSSIGYAHFLSPRPSTNVTFEVNMTDAPAFVPATLTGVKLGEVVSVLLRNEGNYTHSFYVSKIPNVAINTSFDPTQLNAWFTANGSYTNLWVAPGTSAWANFTIPANASGGTYEFVSTVPYQFQSGMLGSLIVSSGTPAATLTEDAEGSLVFTPDVLQVNATKYPVTVGITVTDVGAFPHTWTLSALPNFVLSPGNFTTFFASHAPLADVQLTNDGQTGNATFSVNSPGIYEYICEQPGHFQAGMFGFLYVGVAPPQPVAPLSTAIVQEGILAGAGALLAVAVVLAFASNYLGRFPPPKPAEHH
jgi:uncharacterized cupredoxin-like copper-binding protein